MTDQTVKPSEAPSTQIHQRPKTLWLVRNGSSGSNDDVALADLRDAIRDAGIELLGETCFPEEAPPSPSDLRDKGVDTGAIFAGDGTISSVVAAWSSWDGVILTLPGGTMNLLAKRLHGDVTPSEILSRLESGIGSKVRPTVILSRHAIGLTGALAGPGAAWAEVREAMRDPSLKDLVNTAGEAIASSTGGGKVVCTNADAGREEGYTAISLTPNDDGIEGTGYYVDSLFDYARHGLALIQRDFRNGPNETIGRYERIHVASSDGEPMGLLIDGEIYTGAVEEEFSLSTSDVEFWATASAT